MVDKPTVGKTVVSDEPSVGEDGSMVGNSVDNGTVGYGVDDRVGNGVDGVDGGSGNIATSRGRGVDRLTGVGDLNDVASQVVGIVGDGLDPAVGEGDGVRATDNTVGISGLSSVEVGLGVVVGNTVGVGVGLRGLLDDSDSGGMVGRGGMNDRGSVDNRGSMDGVHNRGSVVDGV